MINCKTDIPANHYNRFKKICEECFKGFPSDFYKVNLYSVKNGPTIRNYIEYEYDGNDSEDFIEQKKLFSTLKGETNIKGDPLVEFNSLFDGGSNTRFRLVNNDETFQRMIKEYSEFMFMQKLKGVRY